RPLELEGLWDYVEYSAPLSFERACAESSLLPKLLERKARLLLHPVHLNLWGPSLEPAERLGALDAHARAVGSPWVSNDVAWWHVDEVEFPGYLYLAPPLDDEGLVQCIAHARHVEAALSMPL